MKAKNIIRTIAIVMFIIVIIVLIFIIYKKDTNIDENGIAYEIYSQYKENVDGGVEFFIKSETFNKMDKITQIEEMEKLLKIYENNRIIKNLYCDSESKFFSFTYNSGEIKGALGGVSLKEWEPMMN